MSPQVDSYAKFGVDDLSPPSWFDRLLWPSFLLLAWLAFELTAHATLSLMLACLKFGMNDFRTAFWLWRRDPQRARGWACSTFFVASGLWKTAIVPLLSAGTITIVWVMINPGAMARMPAITRQIFLALSLGMWSSVVLVLVTGVAAITSLAARWRVWVHPIVHRSRREDHWPPHFHASERDLPNYVPLITLTAIFVAIVVGPVVTLLTMNLFPALRRLRHFAEIAIVLGYPLLGGLGFGLMRTRLFARSPWECWPESIRHLDFEVDSSDIEPTLHGPHLEVGRISRFGEIRP